MLITPSSIARAEEIYNVSESDLIKLLEKYKDEEVVLEDGLVLTVGEAVNLPINEGWTIYNENVAEIVDGELVGKSVGSTFVSQEIDDTVYILEVCITENEVSTASYSRGITKNVDRDYYKVFIDPGHGGYDNGAVRNGVLEDETNLQISKKIEAKLKAKGVQVKMSRYDDTYLSLTDRTRMSNNWGSDIFVSIHQNSATSSSANGIETYYYPTRQDSKELASEIQEDLIQSTNAVNRGVKTANYAVIRTSSMSSSLVECGFISNPTEAKNLSSSSYQDKVAEGIVNGIMEYLESNVILNNSGGNSNNNSGSTTTTQSGTIKVNGGLNVRSGAGTNYSVIGSLSNGAKVEIVETSGSWYKIKYGSGYGYVSKDYVTVSSSNNSGSTDSGNSNNGNNSSTTTQSGTIKVNGGLNVRSGAGTSYSVIGSLSNGAKVEIVETSGSWYKIKYGSGYGYVSKDYVTVSSNNNSGNTDNGNSNNGSSSNSNNGSSSSTTTQSGTVKANGGLNVRSGAGTSYSSIGLLSNGAQVEIVETSGTWYKIKYGSGYGYVSKDYVTVSSSNNSGSTDSGNSNNGSNNNGNSSSTTTQSGTIKVNGALNVRNGAGTSYSVIGSLSNGAKVEIVETSGSWYKIKYGSGYGYVSKDYVTVSSSSNSGSNNGNSSSTTAQSGTVKANGGLNVRSGAGTSYSSIGLLSNGAQVEIVETSGTWYKIKYGSGYGYVSKDYVTINTRSIAENTVLREGTAVTLALKVRDESSYESTVMGTIAMGEKVSVLEDQGEWSKIKYNDAVGYILNEYVDFNIV